MGLRYKDIIIICYIRNKYVAETAIKCLHAGAIMNKTRAEQYKESLTLVTMLATVLHYIYVLAIEILAIYIKFICNLL